MTHDPFPEFPLAPDRSAPRPKPIVTQGLLLAGVAAAGLMGVGLGLWARPAMSERRMAAVAQAPAAATQLTRGSRQIQIVVDDSPAPIGAPIEVLPERPGDAARGLNREAEVESLAPVHPPRGLTRVHAPMPPIVQPAAIARKPMVKAPAEPRREKLQVAKAKPVHGKAGIRLAKGKAKARPAPAVELARAAPAKPPGKLARLLVGLLPHMARLEPEPRVDKVKFDRHAKPAAHRPPSHKLETARRSLKIEKVVAHKPKAKPAPRREAPAPPMRPSGLMKVANHSRCGQSDPGAALVCADPTLGAADRQLNRSYSAARAAGVSDDQLQRQQQRWLAARSAAAREAPWAVHDVYLARIAELNGLAREAHSGN